MTQQNPASPPDQWLERQQLNPLPPARIADWLFNQDSLTRRLTRLSNDGFSVTLVDQGWQTLRDDECAALKLAPASLGWVREVYLRGNGLAWVFARSVAGHAALQDCGLQMDELGTRSLGELLFSDPAFDRGALQVRAWPGQWLPAQDRAEGLWARRSCFSRGPLSILVAEVFLPAFWNSLKDLT
ncbi:chorismate lyase [Pseudomonas sp. LJDD11]|uniref:chorismate--pyruvate lyase family protein n=1 Tax=Pseudomonas sp. LJDD11 TaxID=2931984 RepID=UPI00211CB8C3|nr:chorismate lyase [Pseudomonas sp. LJDD11]